MGVATHIDANDLFKGTVLIVIPHSDDEVLGCGAAIAQVQDKSRLHFVYVSDSSGSPAPPVGPSRAAKELPWVREQEAIAALSSLGVLQGNITFLGFKDGTLSEHLGEIVDRLASLCDRLKPQTLVAPFRYDSHPDHLAVNRAATALIYGKRVPAVLLEYFVYFQSRLLPKRDIRAYLQPRFMRQVYSPASMKAKRAALDCYTSQRKVLYPWQVRPILETSVLDAMVQNPEFYFQADATVRDADIFTDSRWLVRAVHTLEPKLKKAKDRVANLVGNVRGKTTVPLSKLQDNDLLPSDQHAQQTVGGGLPNICIVTETYFPVIGGGETQCRTLAQDLVANGYSVTLLTRRSLKEFTPVEALDGAMVFRLKPNGPGPIKKWGMVLTAFWFLVKNRKRCDIILVSGFRVLGIAAIAAALLTGKKCILKADNNGEMSGMYFTAGIKNMGLDWAAPSIGMFVKLRNALFRRADAFVSLSTDITNELRQHGVRRQAIATIPNSYDPARFVPNPDAADRRLLRERFGFPLDHTIIMFTGRLLTGKGLPHLMRAWKDLSAANPTATLVIVGTGGGATASCEDEIKEYVREHVLGHSVFFTGGVRNVEDYLRCADIFVFPTLDEAFGISLIEAMACGLPPVATAVGGIKDIITDGETGLLVQPSEFQPLFDALQRLLNDPDLARRIGDHAASCVAQRYSRAAVAQTYVDFFTNLMNGMRRA